jgi:putative Holliday junction resolvase
MALIGGPMGRVVPEALFDRPLSYDGLPGMGHGGIVVLDDTVRPCDLARHLFDFARAESCGSCTPCRVGTAALPTRRDQTFLAFDFGTRRVGVASGNTVTHTSQPLLTIASTGDSRFTAIARLVDEWQPDALVVGVPFHPDGAEHENTVLARRFARQLRGRHRLEVHEVDERRNRVLRFRAEQGERRQRRGSDLLVFVADRLDQRGQSRLGRRPGTLQLIRRFAPHLARALDNLAQLVVLGIPASSVPQHILAEAGN